VWLDGKLRVVCAAAFQKVTERKNRKMTRKNPEKTPLDRGAWSFGALLNDRVPPEHRADAEAGAEGERLFTRAFSLVVQEEGRTKPLFVDYIQPAMQEPLGEDNEVDLWLLVYPMRGLGIEPSQKERALSPAEADEFFDFVYGELFPSAYSRDYEGGTSADSAIDGFETYVAALRKRIQGSLTGKQLALVKQNMLSAEARRLILLHKDALNELGLNL
jgi:hypothetical protein